jgi:hypothetical protein
MPAQANSSQDPISINGWARWFVPVIPAAWRSTNGRAAGKASLGKKQGPKLKTNQPKKGWQSSCGRYSVRRASAGPWVQPPVPPNKTQDLFWSQFHWFQSLVSQLCCFWTMRQSIMVGKARRSKVGHLMVVRSGRQSSKDEKQPSRTYLLCLLPPGRCHLPK